MRNLDWTPLCGARFARPIKENNSSYLCTDHLKCSVEYLAKNYVWYCLIIILCSTLKQYFENLVYHENFVTISFILSIEFLFVWQRKNEILPKTLEVYCDSHCQGGNSWGGLGGRGGAVPPSQLLANNTFFRVFRHHWQKGTIRSGVNGFFYDGNVR